MASAAGVDDRSDRVSIGFEILALIPLPAST
jgi:hypothetical protein